MACVLRLTCVYVANMYTSLPAFMRSDMKNTFLSITAIHLGAPTWRPLALPYISVTFWIDRRGRHVGAPKLREKCFSDRCT